MLTHVRATDSYLRLHCDINDVMGTVNTTCICLINMDKGQSFTSYNYFTSTFQWINGQLGMIPIPNRIIDFLICKSNFKPNGCDV